MRRRILFIYLQPGPFVREDVGILAEEYDVVSFHFGSDGKPTPLEFAALLVKQLVWLAREMPRCTAVYGWFVDYHMALPVLLGKLYRKPVAVTIGGFDAVRFPSLQHGIFLSSWRRPIARFVLKSASLLLPVSASLIHSTNRFSEWPDVTEQGARAAVPDLQTPVEVLPTGYDPDAWPMGPGERDAIVATVAVIDSDRRMLIKGVDLLIDAARRLPDVLFRVIGVEDPEGVAAEYRVPDNVELLPRVDRQQLVEHYHAASVYLQLSRSEGLPNVLCEAMLCGCIPVGSRVFGIPEGIGEAGYLVDEPDPAAIDEAIRAALGSNASDRQAARRHIEQHFSAERRRRGLLAIMQRFGTPEDQAS